MIKVKQRLWSGLRIVSLVMCGMFVLLGIRSCSTTDLITRTTEDRHYEVVTIPWNLRFTASNAWTGPREMQWVSGEVRPGTAVIGQRPIYRTWYYFGMGVKRDSTTLLIKDVGRRTITYTIVSVPVQMLAFLCFLPTALWIMTMGRRRRLRQFRVEHSQCVSCGYDVRFSGDRCPECGEKVVRAAGQQTAPI